MVMKREVFLLLIVVFINVIVYGQTESGKNLHSSFDYSDLSFIEAYDSLHATLSLRYPFTDWKAVNWNKKDSVSRTEFVAAAAGNDTIAFTSALFHYLYEIPDGHITISGVSEEYKQITAGGTYGFNMMKIDNGSIVVTYIPEESPAYLAGLRTNDRILKWNGQDINDIGTKEYLNYFRNYATEEGRNYSRYLMLGRDSIGSTSEISYQSHQTKEETTISLTAFDDEKELFLIGIYNTAKPTNFDSLVYYNLVDDKVGYLAIRAELCDGITPEEIIECDQFHKVVEAINYFNDNSIDNLIVDLRFNLGGNDLQAAVTMGLFYQNTSFYEHITANYDSNYEVIYSLWTEPLTPKFDGEIVVIVDPNCISTGEGLAMMFKRAGARVISHCGTNGSFGIVDYDPVLLPAGLQVDFPQARSLDENSIIQLDSDSLLQGGVKPTLRVQLTDENVYDQWVNLVDVQLNYAVQHLLSNVFEEKNTNPKLFPIPSPRYVCIEFDKTIKEEGDMSLYDTHGRQVKTLKLLKTEPGKYMVDLHGIRSGVYFYNILIEGRKHTGKIVITQ